MTPIFTDPIIRLRSAPTTAALNVKFGYPTLFLPSLCERCPTQKLTSSWLSSISNLTL